MFSEQRLEMIKLLVVKDWQVYQKQLAGYLAGLILAPPFQRSTPGPRTLMLMTCPGETVRSLGVT